MVGIEILKEERDFLIVGRNGLGGGVGNMRERYSEEMKLCSERLGWV